MFPTSRTFPPATAAARTPGQGEAVGVAVGRGPVIPGSRPALRTLGPYSPEGGGVARGRARTEAVVPEPRGLAPGVEFAPHPLLLG